MRQTILGRVTFGLFTAALPDMLGSVDIGMRFPSARATPKLRLITSVALLTVATLRARPAGVVRVDQLHQDSCQCRLISDHLAQLPEPPRVQNPSLAVPNFYPCADSIQLLHTDSAPGAFSRANDLLANTVVHMAGETRFSPRQLLPSAFGRTGLLGLQSSPQLPVPPAQRSSPQTRSSGVHPNRSPGSLPPNPLPDSQPHLVVQAHPRSRWWPSRKPGGGRSGRSHPVAAPTGCAARPRTQMASGAGQPQSTARPSRIPDPNSGCAHRTEKPHRFGTSAGCAYPARRHKPPWRSPARPSEPTNQSARGLGSRPVCGVPTVGRSGDAKRGR